MESFRAALGTSCTGAIAVINATGESIITILPVHPNHTQMEEINECILRFINDVMLKQLLSDMTLPSSGYPSGTLVLVFDCFIKSTTLCAL